MVGLLRGPAGARSQRPARQQRLGYRLDWPTQPRPEGPMSSRANLPESTPRLFPREMRCFRLEKGAVAVAGRARVNSSGSGCVR